jgi:L-fucose mutarotase
MLRGIDVLLGPDLLHLLASMGHGDELVIADANFPAASVAQRLVRLDGVDGPRALQAVLSLLPLDSFVEAPALTMQVVGDPDAVPEAVRDYQAILDRAAGRAVKVAALERHAFYARARQAFGVIATGERRFYGNIILIKGVVAHGEQAP